MAPTVSIVIPVYNGANYVRNAIDSALRQTYSDVEVLVVNDGSCDNNATRDICLSFGNRIQYFEKENGGVSAALNFAVERMQGEYFAWLSHDDMYRPDKIERQIDMLCRDSASRNIVFSAYDLLDAGSGAIFPMQLDRTYPGEWLTNSVFPVLTTMIHACTVLMHKSHFARIGFFDEALRATQDYAFLFKLLRRQQTLYSPERLVTVRLHPASGSNTLDCYNREVGNLYYNAAASLKPDELHSLAPSPRALLCKIAGLVQSYGQDAIAQKILAHGNLLPHEHNASVRNAVFRRRLVELSRGDFKSLWIFGTGRYGLRALCELQARMLPVAAWVDNNPHCWGKTFHGLVCYPPERLAKNRDDVAAIVAMRDQTPVLRQLESMGVRRVAKFDLDALLLETPPLCNGVDAVPPTVA